MVVVMEQREIRQDPLTGEHVVLTTVRSRRPSHASVPDWREGEDPRTCPFCPGNESATHPTIMSIDEGGQWVARAFANRSPIVALEGNPAGFALPEAYSLGGLGGFGVHEVIVESPEHEPLHEQAPGRTETALELAVRRLQDLRSDARLHHLQWFRNHGPESGGSQRHPHAQIVGLPFVPERLQRMAGRARHHQATTGTPLLKTVLDDERRDGRRILAREGHITALCPWASSHPFEVWLVPENPGPGLADATDDELRGLASLLPSVVRAIEGAVGGAISYTAVVLGSAERAGAANLGWHMRILPRLARHAGLERSTALSVHGVFPEDAAQALRSRIAAR